jgi:hypothetical protein
MVVPSRGRPHNMTAVIDAWDATNGWAHADLLFALDDDDPALPNYRAVERARAGRVGVGAGMPVVQTFGTWQPMVPKLNAAAMRHRHGFDAVGFAGDDHLPRTADWPVPLMSVLDALGGGIAYGDDGVWNAAMPTWWVMSTPLLDALGRMVPADVEHLYCDNAVAELGRAAGCLHHVPGVLVEHMHPSVGKAPTDRGYAAVNAPRQYARDEDAFVRWRHTMLPAQAAAVRGALARAAAGR